jgi:hypothetical protein
MVFAASLPHVILPSLAAMKLGTFTFRSVSVRSIDERFRAIQSILRRFGGGFQLQLDPAVS